MKPISHNVTIDGVDMRIVRKRVKYLRLAVSPPDGHVRISVPYRLPEDMLHIAILNRLDWIKKQQARFEGRTALSPQQLLSGEHHYYLGKPYRLEIVQGCRRSELELIDDQLLMSTKTNCTMIARRKILDDWYRANMKSLLPGLLEKWQPIVGRDASAWGLRKMKTRWGSCNIMKKRIWLNLELAKYPLECIEYVLVHELVHLLERGHNARFKGLMSLFMPDWRARKQLLNNGPVLQSCSPDEV
jgi:predicted metal-dependent hydrolase